ncbi:MAG: phosphate acyltransferase PlsX [Actinobacteria bacterium]|nr:phosphate acyltransferase PlsX [Actinomycetota bacterium]MBL7060411.1 phosphate acyltransferase PlsX [Actinomycetota bacterium]
MDGQKKYLIIVDAMGGDYAPGEIIKGAVNAAKNINIKIILVGNKEKINGFASLNELDISDFEIVNSTDEIKMDDSPSNVVKHKKNSSIYIGTNFVSKLDNSAFLSAGNTGAVMACSLFNLKRIEGILRPAIAIVIPLAEKKVVLIDAGANVDIKPMYLKQFAIMGKIYCESIFGINNPRIGLINVGTEKKKGSEAVAEGYNLLKESNINFIGNIEGRDIFEGKSDVVVCDGFVGNVILKSFEGMSKLFFTEIKNVLTKNIITKLYGIGLKKYFINMKKKFDYEEYGGALLLGVDGIVIISHGSSKSKAITNAIKVAADGIERNIVKRIKEEIIS